MLNVIYEYSTYWRFTFNMDKCNFIVFHNKVRDLITYGKCISECKCNHHVRFGPHLINEVLVYKYLGLYRLQISISRF